MSTDRSNLHPYLIQNCCYVVITYVVIAHGQGGSPLSEFRKILEEIFRKSTTFSVIFCKKFKNFSEFLQRLKTFVNKNTIKMGNIKVPPSYQRLFFSDIFQHLFKIFEKFLNIEQMKTPTTPLKAIHNK